MKGRLRKTLREREGKKVQTKGEEDRKSKGTSVFELLNKIKLIQSRIEYAVVLEIQSIEKKGRILLFQKEI